MSDEPLRGFASVWDALEETPEAAAQMRPRSELAMVVRGAVEGWGLTRAEAARRLGVTQPRLNTRRRRAVSPARPGRRRYSGCTPAARRIAV